MQKKHDEYNNDDKVGKNILDDMYTIEKINETKSFN